MTTADLVVREQPREMAVLTNEQLQFIASTEFVPPGLRGNLPAILACVATGRALGIADMSALRSIHIIDGKATFSAELMVQLVRREGHSIQGEVTDGKATVTGKRADNGDTMTSTWTLAMAERAGLLRKQNWVKYPEAMLWARAVSQLCRMLFADCFSGSTYTDEELEDVGGGEGTQPGDDQRRPDPDGASVAGAAPDLSAGGPVADGAASSVSAAPLAEGELPSPAGPPASEAMLKKLDVLVGKLRGTRLDGAQPFITSHLYDALGIDPVPYYDVDGVPHWSNLRKLISKAQAHHLIDRLVEYEKKLAEVESAA